MTDTTTTPTTVHSEDYLGHTIAITEADRTYTYNHTTGETRTYVDRVASIDGRRFRCPKGTNAQVAAKLRAMVDTDAADEAILPKLTALIANADKSTDIRPAASFDEVPVGVVAWVYAMGRTRRGIVTAHGRTNVEVAYTTASSGGRVFRKSVPVAKAFVAPAPTNVEVDGVVVATTRRIDAATTDTHRATWRDANGRKRYMGGFATAADAAAYAAARNVG